MTYLFIALLIINTFLTLFIDWKYFICFLGSIVALILTYKPKEKKDVVIDETEKKNLEYLRNLEIEYQPLIMPNQHSYRVHTVKHFKDYFGLVDEYHSAYDQGLLESPEDGVYPLYDYKVLDCKLEQTEETKYDVYVATEKGWNYAGYIDRTGFLDNDIENMKSWYVKVTGGSTYIVNDGRYKKTWQPLHFTLIINLKGTEI